MTDQLNPKAEGSAEAYESGVSNGDVEWLFRGKSKKLTKKMNLNKDLDKDKEKDKEKEKEKESPDNSTRDKEPVSESVVKPPNASQEPKLAAETNALPKQQAKPKEVTEPKAKPKPADVAATPAKELETKEPVRQPSKLDKLFRTRSSSTTKSEPKQKQKEKKLFNLINYSGTSFDGTSIYNQNFENSFLDATVLPSSTRLSSIGSTGSLSAVSSNGSKESASSVLVPSKPRSRSSSIGSNSSATSKEKKSIFSSLSSKFKSAPTPGSSPVIPSHLSESFSSPKESKDDTKLGCGSPTSPGDSLYGGSRPPMEMSGIPIKRKNSITENPSNSLDKVSSSANSFNSFFKRKPSISSTTSNNQNQCGSASRVILNKNPNKNKIPLKELADVDLKRVNFAIDKLEYDPQQQIPSRRPKKGNVLIPEELLAPPPRLSLGISLNDGNKTNEQTPKYSEKELSMAVEAQKRALIEAEKHAEEAHISAKRIAYEVSQYKSKYNVHNQPILENDENETTGVELELEERSADDGERKAIEIDKPLHMHENNFDDEALVPIGDLTLEQIYTRCCHLREILPIPATIKQLKNKTKPLSVLKLLNPKPTLIDILSFSDFISIVPITTIIFDNVTMTTEMLKHILSSLVNNNALEKLSLRNVPIDELGWKYLCKFLARNQSIKKLDISQQRIKADLKPNLIRTSMNWDLFIDCLTIRGGIEELVLNGCKLLDETFKNLIEKAVTINTYRLGIASCDLNTLKTDIVCQWLKNPKCKCVGVDVAFNDLSQGQLKYFTECFDSGNDNLIFFSLYQTNLSNVTEVTELLKSLSKVKSLRFLDLSSLPDLFPGIISKLNTFLPKFQNLKRIHFDLNDLSSASIIALTEILPKINGLLHVSFLGNRNINSSVAASIYGAIKKSKTIHTLDIDYDLINDELNQRIAFYLMRNMDHIIHLDSGSSTGKGDSKTNTEEEELMFDGSLLMETAEKLLAENEKNNSTKIEDIKVNKIISDALIERTRELRGGVHKTIDTLFDKRNKGTLSLEGKESLLRFCLLDSSLEKLVHLFEEHASKNPVVMTPSDSVDTTNASTPTIVEPSHSGSIQLLNKKDNSIDAKLGESRLMRKSHPIIELGDKLLHQSSSELITSGPILSPRNTETLNKLGFFPQVSESSNFQPHQVVVESNSDGKSVPIDNLTGRPVLMRSISQTSTHAKEQELEEGEFHRWGYFMQHRNNSSNDLDDLSKEVTKSTTISSTDPISVPELQKLEEDKKLDSKSLPTLNVLPSGNELRDAIIKAKGIESITELIDKINNNRVSLDKIYSITDKAQQAELLQQFEKLKMEQDKQKNAEKGYQEKIDDDNESIDSMGEEDQVDAVVDEVYDKLLNDAERVRSNK